MSNWPWSQLNLPADASEDEVQAAWQKWRAGARPSDPGYADTERAFAAAFEQAAGRPAFIPRPKPAPPQDDADREPKSPWGAQHQPSSTHDATSELARDLLDRAEAAADYDDFIVRVNRLSLWTQADVRAATDLQVRELLLDRPARAAAIVRMSRMFDWQPESPPLQSPERDERWRSLVRAAWQEFAPPDPAYTGNLGRVFLIVGAVLAVLLSLLILPRVLSGSVGILIPLAFAALCAFVLIQWKR